MIENSPIIVAILAILALPGVTSMVTSAIRKVSDATGIKPEAIVYAVSLAVTGAILATTGLDLPGIGDSPTATVGLWLAWATANAALARTVYEILHPRLVPAT